MCSNFATLADGASRAGPAGEGSRLGCLSAVARPRTANPGAQGRGIGAALLDALIGSAEAAGIWTIQTGIFPENTTSLRLHQRAGFRVVGTRQRVGCHHGRWRDVTILERRSTVTGT